MSFVLHSPIPGKSFKRLPYSLLALFPDKLCTYSFCSKYDPDYIGIIPGFGLIVQVPITTNLVLLTKLGQMNHTDFHSNCYRQPVYTILTVNFLKF